MAEGRMYSQKSRTVLGRAAFTALCRCECDHAATGPDDCCSTRSRGKHWPRHLMFSALTIHTECEIYACAFTAATVRLAPCRCVDLRTINSGCSTTLSTFGGTLDCSTSRAILSASSPIRRLC